MTVIFQIEAINELEEIQQWLSKRKIVIQKTAPPAKKIGATAFLKRLKRYQVNLPADYRFNRDQAHER